MLPFLQQFLPQHGLSRFAGWMANCEISWIKNQLIRYFINRYPVNMTEALEPDPYTYKSFNAFFTRSLEPNARPIASNLYDFVSPADGIVSQVGNLDNDQIIQAKNHHYSVQELLGGDSELAKNFAEGAFLTIYLAPPDYHRVHMPIDGKLQQMIYIPGKLFSVNMRTTESIPNLFAMNERVVSIFDTSVGKVAIILIGAMLVGSIETVWAGTVTLHHSDNIGTWNYDGSPRLRRGEEMGRFKLGSTVIVLLEKDAVTWDPGFDSLQHVQMGRRVGHLKF